MKSVLLVLLTLIPLWASADVLEGTRKVSLIFVGPAKGLSESSFGHVALKLSPDKDGGLLDLVIEFVADVPRNENPLKKYFRGAGIGKKYQVKAELSSFYDFKKLKTITENRSLTVYDLRLSENEVSKVVEFIRNYQEKDVGENYLFLTKNCSYFAAHALETATGKKIKAKILPWKVGKKLIRHDLVSDERNYDDGASERMRFARRFVADGVGESFPAGWKDTFIKMLGERSITLRQSSYLKLLWLRNSPRASDIEKKKSQSLLRYLLTFENEVNQFTIKNLFHDTSQKKVIALPLVRYEGANLPKAASIRHDLVIADKSPVISLSWGQDGAKIPLPQISFSDDLSLKYQDLIVGRFIRTKSDKWILSQRLDYGLDVNNENNTIQTLLYIDKSQNVKDLKLSLTQLQDKGIIALNNAIDFKGEAGSCYALALLQKAFLERAIFVPEASRKETDKLLLMKELFHGKYVVIAGYKNISDFTGSIPKETLKSFIRSLQATLQKDKFSQMKENILEREILDKVTDERLKAMLDEGLHIPLVIGMSEKGTLKPASHSAHVILVHDMKEIPEGYRLTAYDPNTGLNTLFVLNKKFRLDYPFYDKNFDYVALIDRITPEAMNLDHAVRSRGPDEGKITFLLRNKAAVVLESAEITKVLP